MANQVRTSGGIVSARLCHSQLLQIQCVRHVPSLVQHSTHAYLYASGFIPWPCHPCKAYSLCRGPGNLHAPCTVMYYRSPALSLDSTITSTTHFSEA
ncbi:hypothetical protein CGRA01v4_09063 [Colletotrichum graminicola]|nr:hypothetical protein CGRA01v4_09063 [Colletotrichum graminicola]